MLTAASAASAPPEPWMVRKWSRGGKIISACYDGEALARTAFEKCILSAVLLDPSGGLACERRGVLDAYAEMHLEILRKCTGKCPEVFERQWTLGSHRWGGVQWEVFPTEESARLRCKAIWWSKVLFDPAGVPVLCATGRLDKLGKGVAAILSVRSQRADRSSDAAVLRDMARGRAPFVPRTAAEGANLSGKALKWFWPALAGRSSLSKLLPASLCFFDVKRSPQVRGYVALTIDDAPCRLGRPNSMVPEVGALLREHSARATFMVMGDFVRGCESELVSLLEEGHELGNHGLVDRPYHKDSEEEVDRALSECSAKIRSLQRLAQVPEGVTWFRAPHGRMSPAIAQVLRRQGLANVMCDTYACCPVVQDAQFIGQFLSSRAQDGSVLLIHMPERGFREWCLEGLRLCLEGLRARGLQAVTVGELAALATAEAQDLGAAPSAGAAAQGGA